MEVFKLVGSIFVKNKDANDAIDETTDKAEKASGELGKAFGTIAKGLGVAVTAGMTAVSFLTKGALDAYANYEQLVGGVEMLFNTSADKVLEYANRAYKTAGLSANEYMETVTSFSASLLQGLSGDTAKAAEIADLAIIDMADNANKMGTSMEAIQNAYQGFAKQNYTMLDNLKLGYGGTQEEMVRLINDSGVLNEKINSMNGISFDTIIMAIHEVQNNLGFTGTTALEAEATISGSLASLRASWKNTLTAMGNDGADFNTVITELVDSATTAFGNLLPRIQIIFQAIPTLVNQLAPQIPIIVQSLLPALLQGALALLNGLVASMPGLIGALMAMLPVLIDGVMQLIGGMLGNISSIIEPIIMALPNIIMLIITGLINNLPLIIQGLVQVVVMLTKAIPQIVSSLIASVPTVIMMLIKALFQSFPQLLAAVGSLVMLIPRMVIAILSGLIGAIANIFNSIRTVAANIWESIKNAITAPIEKARDKVRDVIERIKSFFKFDWSLPKLKMPHLRVSGKFSLLPPSVPKFGIEWYAKAMDDPVLFTKPTLFDINPVTGTAKGAGEAGHEIMIGKDAMLSMIQESVAREISSFESLLTGILNLLSEHIPELASKQLVLDSGAVVGELAPTMDMALGNVYRKKQRGV